MAAFLKNLSRFLSPGKSAPAAYLSAFGKHPGWNDHIDDLGLDTDALVTAKRLLYVQGISQNIDAGAWDALEPPAPGNSIVNGSARFMGWFAGVIRFLQSGYIYHYAFAMIIGVFVLMTWFVWLNR